MPALEHTLLGSFEVVVPARVIVPVTPYEPDESTTAARVQSLVIGIVVDEGDGVSQLASRLTLCPVDDLQHICAGHVVGTGPTDRRLLTTAVQVDPESGLLISQELSRSSTGSRRMPPSKHGDAVSGGPCPRLIRSWLPSMAAVVKGWGPGRPSSVRRRWSVSTSFARWGAAR